MMHGQRNIKSLREPYIY